MWKSRLVALAKVRKALGGADRACCWGRAGWDCSRSTRLWERGGSHYGEIKLPTYPSPKFSVLGATPRSQGTPSLRVPVQWVTPFEACAHAPLAGRPP